MPQLFQITGDRINRNLKTSLEAACKKIISEVIEEVMIDEFEGKIVRPGTAIVRYHANKKEPKDA
jgi:hypothetical protein